MVILAPATGSDKMRIGLLAAVGALAFKVNVPIVTVAPPIALFAETVPTALAFAVVPSVVVVEVQAGVVFPLVDPAILHPPPVHFWSRPPVSTTSLFNAKAEDGVQGPTVGAVPLVMLKLITQPPCVAPDAPHEVDPTPAKSQSVFVLELKNSVSGEHPTLLLARTGPVTTEPSTGPPE
jgi:hypothetical protein